MTPIVVGADDYGIAPGVSAAVRELIDAGRLSATSCMVTGPGWAQEAARLRAFDGRADLGLHLVLTDQPSRVTGKPMGSFGALARAALLRHLDLAAVAAELQAQVQAFEAAIGRPPDYLDGHQHSHQLPGVREIVLELASRLPVPRVRVCVERPSTIWRRGVAPARAAALSVAGLGLARLARQAGVRTNDGLTGVYGFDGDYASMMPRFLMGVRAGTFLLTHPGRVDDALRAADPLLGPREVELAFLAGDGFPEALRAAGVRVARWSEALPHADG